ncbi:MAG: hypothetical protein HY763_04665 [Planctomycetes bacterium]|nr:hypothetical protein [Planctomycetota bacterium]
MTPSATSGDDAPASRLRPGWLHLHLTELGLEFEGSLERRRVRSSRAFRADTIQRNRDERFSESVSLRFSGDIVDPNLIRWDSSFKLGLSQERYREQTNYFTRSDSDTGLLLEYDVAVDILPAKPVSAQVYARRSRDRIPRRFLPSLLEERSDAGAAVYATHGIWTGELGFDWSDVDRTGNRSDEDDERLETARFYLDNRWVVSDAHHLRIAFDHEREESQYQGSEFAFDTRRDQLRVEHELAFGEARRHRLDTYIRWNNEQGDLARDETEITPRLTLRHSDAWETIYRYSFYRVEQDAIEVTRHKADVQAIFKPGEPFRLSADFFAIWERVDKDVEVHEFGGVLDATLRQPTRLGTLSASASFQAEQSRTVGSGGERVVHGEAHTLDPTRPTFLNELDVRRATLRAYNADRTRVYLPARDYTVLQVGRRTVVNRLLSGRITENEVVYFDYRYRIPAGARIDSYRADVWLEHEFTFGLTPYYGFEIRRQDAAGSRGTPVFTDNTERHGFGLRYDRPSWNASGEVELFDDSVEPYDAFHLHGRWWILRTAAHSLDASARADHYSFKGDFAHRRVATVDLDVTHTTHLSSYLSTSLAAGYRWEDNSRDGETDGVDLEGTIRYQRGALSVELTVEYDLLALRENRDEGFGVWVNIRRDLSHLLPGRKAERSAWAMR